MATQTALDPKVTEFIKYLTMIQTELRNLKTPEPRRARLYNRLFLVAKSLNNILKARMTDSQLKRHEINIEWFEELIANLDTLGPQIMPAITNFDEELRIIKQLCYGKSKYHRPDTFPDKTIVGNDIYNLVAATHQVARLKRLIRKKSIDDKNLRSERTQFETRITALLGAGMRQIGCNSWVEYICKKPEIAHEKLTPTIADLLHTMRYLEYQYRQVWYLVPY